MTNTTATHPAAADEKTARAFAPGHITGFFEIADDDPDPLKRGSRGAGVSLAAGAVTEVRLSPSRAPSLSIIVNNRSEPDAPVSRRVMTLFNEATNAPPASLVVDHSISVPQGAGFGSSGAGALSLALALNAASGFPLEACEAAQLAHRAEIDCRTGLGTVLACTTGGLEVRTGAGAPGVGSIRSFPAPAGFIVLCFVYGPLPTAAALADAGLRQKINAVGASLRARFLADPTIPRFLSLSREFTEAVGLVSDRLRRLLDEFDRQGVTAAMTMFGEAVFTIVETVRRTALASCIEHAKASGAHLFESRISQEGGILLNDA